MLTFTNERKFTKDLEEFAKTLEIEANLVVKRIAFELFIGIVQKTPVDTGWARVNWTISRDAMDTTVVGTKGASGEGEAVAIAANNQALSKAAAGGVSEVWYVSNSIPYIIPLENGHSKQSGKGYMVERTMYEVTQNIKSLMADVKKANGGNLPRVSS